MSAAPGSATRTRPEHPGTEHRYAGNSKTAAKVTLEVEEVDRGARRDRSHAGRSTGRTAPILRGRSGDIFETLINSGTMGHSLDFTRGMVSPGLTQ